MPQQQRPVGARDLAEHRLPRDIGRRRDHELREEDLNDAGEHRGLVGEVTVDRHAFDAELGAQATHRQRVEPVTIDDREGRAGDAQAAERRSAGG